MNKSDPTQTPPEEKIKILYISGATRSGSTLLSRLLGEIQGFVNVGEALRWLFNTERMNRSTPCGCEQSVFECPFWKNIVPNIEHSPEQAFGTKIIRIRYIPQLMFPYKRRQFDQNWQSLLKTTEQLVQAIYDKSDGSIIVDSSKNPANAYLLSQIPTVDLHILHLVRDPRGVVKSWAKPKAYLPAFPTRTVTGWWISYNLGTEIIRPYAKSFQRIKYEDFLSAPENTLKQIISFIGVDKNLVNFFDANTVRLQTQQHILASNPDKLTTDTISIEKRDWHLDSKRHYAVTLMTLPILLKYHYPILN